MLCKAERNAAYMNHLNLVSGSRGRVLRCVLGSLRWAQVELKLCCHLRDQLYMRYPVSING